MKRKDHTEEWLADFEPRIAKGKEEVVTEELIARFQIEHLERESKDEPITALGLSPRSNYRSNRPVREAALPTDTVYIFVCNYNHCSIFYDHKPYYYCLFCGFHNRKGETRQYVYVNAFPAIYGGRNDSSSMHTEDLRDGRSEETSGLPAAMPTETDVAIAYRKGYNLGFEHGTADAYNNPASNRSRNRSDTRDSRSLYMPW